MHATTGPRSTGSGTPIDISTPADDSNLGDAERGLPLAPRSVPLSVRSLVSNNVDDETELQTRPPTASSSTSYLRHKTSQIFDAVLGNGSKHKAQDTHLPPALATLVEAYAASDVAAGIKSDGDDLRREVVRSDNGNAVNGGNGTASQDLPDVVLETSMLRGRKRASWATQFRILSGRAFKNLYRDPALLTAHYLSAVALALVCGLFYHNVTYVPTFS